MRIADHLVAGGSATEISGFASQDVIKDAASEQMYVDGQINLLSNYESDDLAKVKSLYKLIDQNDAISSLIGFNPKDEIKNDSKSKVQVKLGSGITIRST